MARRTEAHLEAAKRLLERARNGESLAAADVAGRAYDELFRTLAPVLGVAGVHALFARSARLASGDFPVFAALAHGRTGGDSDSAVTERLIDSLRSLDEATALHAATELLGAFLGLLIRFIGEQLVGRMVKGAFPEMDDSDSEETE